VERARDIAIVNSRLAERITALLREITARLSQLAAQRRGLLHGCLTPNQLLADGEAIAVIDFDAACHGDPAIDVGTFVGSMRKCGTKARERRAVERSAELFLQEYGAASNDPGVVDRARLFACQELLRYAGRSFLRTAYRLGDGGGRPTRFLDEAEAALSTL
jgi:aminoglycoside phosphotransferase (APT) family kinase protein